MRGSSGIGGLSRFLGCRAQLRLGKKDGPPAFTLAPPVQARAARG